MSQKFIKSQNKNEQSTAFGKYYAMAVYDNHFIGTEELADFIQRQASVKKSDIKAVLQELGEAFKHFFELGSAPSVSPNWKTVVLRPSPPVASSSSPRRPVSLLVRASRPMVASSRSTSMPSPCSRTLSSRKPTTMP